MNVKIPFLQVNSFRTKKSNLLTFLFYNYSSKKRFSIRISSNFTIL